jgi:hypothetical protein
MQIHILSNGDLEMLADVNEQNEIFRLRKDSTSELVAESQFISELIDPMGDGKSYEQVAPEEIGALTGAPIISDGETVWGYMQYQVFNFLEELVNGHAVVWKKGN